MHITKHFSFQAKPNQYIPIIVYTIKAVPIVEQILQKHKLKITYNHVTCNKPKQSRLLTVLMNFEPNQAKLWL